MPNDLSKEEAKQAMKEAIREWMDEQFAALGRWTLGGIAVAALGLLTYFILLKSGWHK